MCLSTTMFSTYLQRSTWMLWLNHTRADLELSLFFSSVAHHWPHFLFNGAACFDWLLLQWLCWCCYGRKEKWENLVDDLNSRKDLEKDQNCYPSLPSTDFSIAIEVCKHSLCSMMKAEFSSSFCLLLLTGKSPEKLAVGSVRCS